MTVAPSSPSAAAPSEVESTEGQDEHAPDGLDAGPTAEPPGEAVADTSADDHAGPPADGLDGPTVATTAVATPDVGSPEPASPEPASPESRSADPPDRDHPEADTTELRAHDGTSERRRFRPPRWLWGSAAALAVVVLVLAAVAAPSLTHALTRPGSDTVAARLAEWGRDHGLGPVVTWLEARQYELDQPPTGGTPAGGIPHANGAVADHPGGSPAPPPLPAPAGVAPLPGEGQWQAVVSTPHGDAVRMATVRPDAAHTSFLVGVLWMDPTLVRGVLHPGTEDPGGSWSVPSSIDPTEQRTVVSAFSAGFRLQGDSHGGWYLDGKEARPLVPGAASLVTYRNGRTDVGAWGSEVRMSPDVAAVRQNLIPLVDQGVVNPTCATGGTAEWGSTVGSGGLHQPVRVRRHRERCGDLRGRPGTVGVHARRHPPLGRGGARDGARHQPRMGLRRVLPPERPVTARWLPALPRRAGRCPALPADLEPGLHVVRPPLGRRHRGRPAVGAAPRVEAPGVGRQAPLSRHPG